MVSTHSHPKVAAYEGAEVYDIPTVSTHSHPKVAAQIEDKATARVMFQHTATRRWLQPFNKSLKMQCLFQHTATRRWLLAEEVLAWII